MEPEVERPEPKMVDVPARMTMAGPFRLNVNLDKQLLQ